MTQKVTIVYSLMALIIGMFGLAYASVPLYRLFCQVTGLGGTTQRMNTEHIVPIDRMMKIRFNADLAPDMPWQFTPDQLEMNVKVGEKALAFYTATNTADYPIKGTAHYNVTPAKMGVFFAKIECFCFEEQIIEAGETVQFPVAFQLDPAMQQDPNVDEVNTITLSYTFYPMKD